jgi:hypothetical protein
VVCVIYIFIKTKKNTVLVWWIVYIFCCLYDVVNNWNTYCLLVLAG